MIIMHIREFVNLLKGFCRMKIQKSISASAYTSESFVGKYQKLIKDVVVPYQYSVLCDAAADTEKSHVVQNFINAAHALRGEDTADGFYGEIFQDSDAAKWIEAAAYSLANFPDKDLEKTVDSLIDIIAEAQDEDGYLDTYFTVKDREKRWTNLLEGHELYCAGHMMEAACAYYEVTGKDKLLKVMEKNAEHIYNRFIAEKHEGVPGHPEVELALMKMYRCTKNKHCLELAEHFVNSRGVNPDYFRNEYKNRGWTVWGNDGTSGEYQQSGKPVREQTEATGHAVRAGYLYTGMADIASKTGDNSLYEACKRLWENITRRRMYITGGIGSTVHGKAFSVDYDLPNDTTYCETCASVALMFFASRMLENEVKGEYGDVMERAFYNTVLAGMQLDGKRFFYVNPLEVTPGISGISPVCRHDLPERPKWYACACCPPNVARLIASLGKYSYGESDDTAYCHLFAAGEVCFRNGIRFRCETEYPYDFTATYHIQRGGKIAVRIPAWSESYTVKLNGEAISPKIITGYAYIDTSDGDELAITLDGTPKFAYGSVKIPQLSGKLALCRGPLVYCFEGVDNGGDVFALSVKGSGSITLKEYDEKLPGGTLAIEVDACRRDDTESLYSLDRPKKTECKAIAVPYYTWGNRGLNQMRVWINEV